LEFDFAEFLREWKSETFHRLELGQMYCSWMERLYGGQQKEYSYLLRKMHRDMAQLVSFIYNLKISHCFTFVKLKKLYFRQ